MNCMLFDITIIFIFESKFKMLKYDTTTYYLLLPGEDCMRKLRYPIISRFLRRYSN